MNVFNRTTDGLFFCHSTAIFVMKAFQNLAELDFFNLILQLEFKYNVNFFFFNFNFSLIN